MRWRRLRRLGPWWIVSGLATVGLAITPLGQARIGGYLIGLACIVGAVLRTVVSSRRAGGLRVRRRWVDAVTLAGLAALVLLAYTLVRLTPT